MSKLKLARQFKTDDGGAVRYEVELEIPVGIDAGAIFSIASHAMEGLAPIPRQLLMFAAGAKDVLARPEVDTDQDKADRAAARQTLTQLEARTQLRDGAIKTLTALGGLNLESKNG